MSDREVLIQKAKSCQLAILVGMDLSTADTGLPSGRELAHGLAHTGNLPTSDSLAEVVQAAKQEGQDWLPPQYLKSALPTAQEPGPLHKAVASMPVQFLMTTTYDDRLASALTAAGHSLNLLISDQDTWLPSRDRDLLKLCGDLSRLNLLAVAEEDYIGLTTDNKRSALFDRAKRWLKQTTVLLLGCDPTRGSDFDRHAYSQVLERLGAYGTHGYLVWPDPAPADVTRWAQRNVTIMDAEPLALIESLATELKGITVTRPPDQELAALQALVEMLGKSPTQAQVDTALSQITAAQRPNSIAITFRLWLSDQDKLQSILDVNYTPNVTHYYGQPVSTDISLQTLQDWAKAAQEGRQALKKPEDSIQDQSIQLFQGNLAVDDRKAYENALRDSRLLDASPYIVLAVQDKKGRLAAIPWELLHDGLIDDHGRGFLGLKYPVYRLPTSVSSLGRVTGQIKRALIVAADPTRQLANLDEEAAWLKQTLTQANITVDVRLSDDADVGDPEKIRDLIRDGDYQLLHFVGHGQFNPDNPAQSKLILGHAKEKGKAITATALAQVARESKLILVFLSACEGAGEAGEKTLPWQEAGLVDALIRAGVPATVGMRWIVGDVNSRQLVKRFYETLLGGDTLEHALMLARQKLGDAGQSDWANPILTKRHGVLD
jgi:CHAT domain-containing protein